MKKNKKSDMSQQKNVTMLRILYPIWAIVGMFSIMYVPGALIVAGKAVATAKNIIANELLFRMGIVGSLITQLIYLWVVLILYKLFEAIDKDQAKLMVIFVLVAVPIAMLNTLNRVGALVLAKSANYAQMMFFLNLNEQGMLIATIFWGLWLFPLGYLVYKSGYFPKILALFLVLSGSKVLVPSYPIKFAAWMRTCFAAQ